MDDDETDGLIAWIVDISRSASEPLGIVLDAPTLTVKHVSLESAAGRWNEEYPEAAICQGDQILEVNGEQSVEGIARACQDADSLRMVLARESDGPVAGSLASDGDGLVAKSMVQGIIEAAKFCCEEDNEEGFRAFAWEVHPPGDSREHQRSSSSSHAKPAGLHPPALAASPYASVVLPEGKPRHGGSPRKKKAKVYGFRSCRMQPPGQTLQAGHVDIPLPPTPRDVAPQPPVSPAAMNQHLWTWKVPTEQQQLPAQPPPMPDWVVREAILCRASIVAATEAGLRRKLDASEVAVPPSPRPQAVSPPRRAVSPPRIPDSFAGANPVKRPDHLDMYSRPIYPPSQQRQRPPPRAPKHRPPTEAYPMAIPERGERHIVPAPDCPGQPAGKYFGVGHTGTTHISLPPLAEEEKIRAWRENMVNSVLCLARTSDVPLGLLPKTGSKVT